MDAQPPHAGADSAGADRIELLRRWILIILVLGLLGTVTELVLLEHYEQPTQFVPLVLIVAALAALFWEFRRRDMAGRRGVLRVVGPFLLGGLAPFLGALDRSPQSHACVQPVQM